MYVKPEAIWQKKSGVKGLNKLDLYCVILENIHTPPTDGSSDYTPLQPTSEFLFQRGHV